MYSTIIYAYEGIEDVGLLRNLHVSSFVFSVKVLSPIMITQQKYARID